MTVGCDGGPSGAFSYALDAGTAALQREVRAVVEQYQAALNAGDFPAISVLFATDAVAEWNETQTMLGVAAMAPAYAALFERIEFSTDFQFDAIDIYGDIALVRTHHPVGQMEVERGTGKRTVDLNREIFVVRKGAQDWAIILYTFNTQPRQGEQ